MDSSAISRLITLIKTVQQEDGRIAFWGLNKDLLNILHFVNIPNFAIANSKDGIEELFF